MIIAVDTTEAGVFSTVTPEPPLTAENQLSCMSVTEVVSIVLAAALASDCEPRMTVASAFVLARRRRLGERLSRRRRTEETRMTTSDADVKTSRRAVRKPFVSNDAELPATWKVATTVYA